MDWFKAALDLVFPPRCVLCGISTVQMIPDCLCPQCWQQIEYLKPPWCGTCGTMVAGSPDHNHFCGACLCHPPPYSRARSCIRYDQPARQLLHRLKYNGDKTVLPAIRCIIAHADIHEIDTADLILPVPLFVKRLKARGLNQAEILARQFFPEQIERIRTDILLRVLDTRSQTTLSGTARRNNLRSAFQVQKRASVKGGKVCLVDDVFTTGTTVAECAKILLDSGAKEVWVLTLARVVMKR
jgi:ComF family protein